MNTSPEYRAACMQRLMVFVNLLLECPANKRQALIDKYAAKRGAIALREALNVERGIRSGKVKKENFV